MEGGGGGLSNFLTELTPQARDRPDAMFNLELKWERGKGRRLISIKEETNLPYPPLPSSFFTVAHPLGTNLFLSPAFRSCKNQRWQLRFKQILNTRSPKLHLLGRLCESRSVCKCQCLDNAKCFANTYLLCNRKVRIVEPCSHNTLQGGAVCSARLWAG